MDFKIPKEQKEKLVASIQNVLDTGEPWEDEQTHFPAESIIRAVSNIPGVRKKDTGLDTNGWQWDWWQEFTYKGKDYTLSGSGYYGGHAFELSD